MRDELLYAKEIDPQAPTRSTKGARVHEGMEIRRKAMQHASMSKILVDEARDARLPWNDPLA